jgi:hypothetical protein
MLPAIRRQSHLTRFNHQSARPPATPHCQQYPKTSRPPPHSELAAPESPPSPDSATEHRPSNLLARFAEHYPTRPLPTTFQHLSAKLSQTFIRPINKAFPFLMILSHLSAPQSGPTSPKL